jgi:hypothetical protein
MVWHVSLHSLYLYWTGIPSNRLVRQAWYPRRYICSWKPAFGDLHGNPSLVQDMGAWVGVRLQRCSIALYGKVPGLAAQVGNCYSISFDLGIVVLIASREAIAICL